MKQERLLSLDRLRGLIMVMMAVDHANFFIARVHPAEYWGSPLPQYSDVLSFLTRLITHPCAPGFFFLMGTGMALFAASRRELGWREGRIRRFFTLRGSILIGLELFVVNAAWLMGVKGSRIDFQAVGPGGGGDVIIAFMVLAALGFSMIFSSLLLQLGPMVLSALGASALVATQVLVPGAENVHTLYNPLMRLLWIPGQTQIVSVIYPILPWLGICLLGMAFGKMILNNRRRAFRWAFVTGIASVILFVIMRIIGGFGNIHEPLPGWIGFLNLTKYPPSLTFTLLMLAVNLLLLALFEKSGAGLRKWGEPLLTFGRSALFFYMVHMFVFAFLGFLFPSGSGFLILFLFWLLVLLILYPLCRWYGRFKRQTPPTSIWRFF